MDYSANLREIIMLIMVCQSYDPLYRMESDCSEDEVAIYCYLYNCFDRFQKVELLSSNKDPTESRQQPFGIAIMD